MAQTTAQTTGSDPTDERLRARPPGTPWAKVALTAATSASAFALGALSGNLLLGSWAFLGGFASFYIDDQPYRQRALILRGVAAGLAVAAGVGALALAWPLMAGAFGLLALASTWAAGRVRLPLPGAFMFLLVASVTAASAKPGELLPRVGMALVGGAIAWVVGMAGALLRPAAPARRATAGAFEALARYAEAVGSTSEAAAAHRAALALTTLGPGARARAASVFLALTELGAEEPGRLDAGWAVAVRALGHDRRGSPPPIPSSPATDAARRLAAVLRGGARPVTAPRTSEFPSARPAVPPFLPHASVRAAIALALAVAVAHFATVAHPYWLPLTVAAVLQGHTVEMLTRRALERVIGTVAGLVLVFAILLVLQPSPLAALALVLALQALMRVLMPLNYGLAVAPMTAFALLLVEVAKPTAAWGLVSSRLVDTGLGVSLALAATYLLWPRASSARLPDALADTLRAEAALLRSPPDPGAAPPADTARATLRSLDRLYRVADDARQEVPPARRALSLSAAVDRTVLLGYRLLARTASANGTRAEAAVRAQASQVLDALAKAVTGPGDDPRGVRPVPDIAGVGADLRTLMACLPTPISGRPRGRQSPRGSV